MVDDANHIIGEGGYSLWQVGDMSTVAILTMGVDVVSWLAKQQKSAFLLPGLNSRTKRRYEAQYLLLAHYVIIPAVLGWVQFGHMFTLTGRLWINFQTLKSFRPGDTSTSSAVRWVWNFSIFDSTEEIEGDHVDLRVSVFVCLLAV